MFVGYPNNQKGWKLYDMDTGVFFVSRDVKFHENEFPFASLGESHTTDSGLDTGSESPSLFLEDPEVVSLREDALNYGPTSPSSTAQNGSVGSALFDSTAVSLGSDVSPVVGTPNTNSLLNATSQPCETPVETSSAHVPLHSPTSSTPSPSDISLVNDDHVNMGRGHRTKYPSVRLQGYTAHTVSTTSPPCSSPLSRSSGTPYPIAHFVNCTQFSVRHRNFIAAITAGLEPRTFKEAMKDAGWREATRKEISAL